MSKNGGFCCEDFRKYGSVANFPVFQTKRLLTNLIQDKKLKPIKSVDEIIEFMIATYQGIQTVYVLSGSYDADELSGKYDPCKMFSCMAETIILMMGGR